MRGFLWCQGPMAKGKAKVAWKDLCVPKYEGGLGIRRIGEVNKSLMITHNWSILTKRESLWVDWIYTYRLKGRSFWDVPLGTNVSWGWRKLLQLRDLIRPYTVSRIGNGCDTFSWHDTWCAQGPLYRFMSPRDINKASFTLNCKVADIVSNGAWKWLEAWFDLFPVLINIAPPNLQHNKLDTVNWVVGNKDLEFSSYAVWDTIRVKLSDVNWVHAVWFPQCIPRHAFHMWLIQREKLKTHDKMQVWDVESATNLNLTCCSLCKTGPDSHAHLGFECTFSSEVWRPICDMVGIQPNLIKWSALNYPALNSKSKRIDSIVGKLYVAATSYFVWQERNNRMFTNKVTSAAQVKDVVIKTVRYRLATIRFKQSVGVARYLESWKIPNMTQLEAT